MHTASSSREAAMTPEGDRAVDGKVIEHKKRTAFSDWSAPTCMSRGETRENVSEAYDQPS